MNPELLKSITLPKYGKPVADLTDSERLGLYIAAGNPVETDSKTGDKQELLLTLRSAVPFGIADNGSNYVVVLKP